VAEETQGKEAAMKNLLEAIDRLEDAIATHFAGRDVPVEIQTAVSNLEEAMIEAGLSPLRR
jgi:hypothetical protein